MSRTLLILLFVPVCSASLCSPDSGTDPCELDRLGCEDPPPGTHPPEFYLDDCPEDVTGPLELVIGSGEAAFTALAGGQGPFVHFGPQGGQHVFMGFQVLNARLDASPLMSISFFLGQGSGCEEPPDQVGTLPSCEVTIGKRDLLLGGPGFELRTNPQGDVEESGIVVFVDVPDPELTGMVTMIVEDQCRRVGAVYHRWTDY